jgi:hypothetical protein
MTEEEQASLVHLAGQLRRVAGACGPLHAYWDLIFDIEACLQEREMRFPRSAAALVEAGKAVLAELDQDMKMMVALHREARQAYG